MDYIVSVEKQEDAEEIERTYACEGFYRCRDCRNYNGLMEQCIVDGSFCDPTAYCCNVEPKDGEQE